MNVWRLLQDDGVSASLGLATDECLAHRVVTGISQPTLRLYTYRSHCALVGRFQNIDNEINRAYCEANGIQLNRRPTGGGAIIMGKDQLGIALCIPGREEDSYRHARELMVDFSAGIICGLEILGIQADFWGKNDIEINNRKVAGLGVYRAPEGGLLFHASVLIDLDITFMLHVLKTPFEKITDKAIATVADRVTTMRRETGSPIVLDTIRDSIAAGYRRALGISLAPGDLTSDELEAIDALEKSKYLTSDWVYQTTAIPDTFGSAKVKTPAGLLDVRATLAGNTIKAIFIGGDFFATEGAVAGLEARLRWHPASSERVQETLVAGYAEYANQLNNLPVEALQEAIRQAVRAAQKAETAVRADPYGCFVNPQDKERS
ncbi:MAG: lipoate--protein ligase family protein [Ktedonobacteraceae bacterium]